MANKRLKSVSFARQSVRKNPKDEDSDSYESDSDVSVSSVSSAGSDIIVERDLFLNIRKQSNSGLESQKHLAATLHALEASLVEQKVLKFTPIAYFTSILSILEQDETTSMSNLNTVTSLVYLLQTVIPEISAMVLSRHFVKVGVVLMSISEKFISEAPIIKSNLQSFRYLLAAQSLACWKAASSVSGTATNEAANLCKSMFMHMVSCAIEHVPKVRRIARDGLVIVLKKPPSPSIKHPANIWVLEYASALLTRLVDGQNDLSGNLPANLFHLIALLRSLHPLFHLQMDSVIFQKLSTVVSTLQQLVFKSASTHVQVAAIEALRAFFQPINATKSISNICADANRLLLLGNPEFEASFETITTGIDLKWVDHVLREVLELLVCFTERHSSSHVDPIVLKSWIQVINEGLCLLGVSIRCADGDFYALEDTAAKKHPKLAAKFVSLQLKVATLFFSNLGKLGPDMQLEAFKVFETLCSNCVLSTKQLSEPSKSFEPLVSLILDAFDSIEWNACRSNLVLLLAQLFDRIRIANWLGECQMSHFAPIVSRTLDKFVALKEDPKGLNVIKEIDLEFQQLIQNAVSAVGVTQFLKMVPLLFDATGKKAPRPWLLPLIQAAFESDIEHLCPKNGADGDIELKSTSCLSSVATTVVDNRLDMRPREPLVTPHSLLNFFEFWVPTAISCFQKASQSASNDTKARQVQGKLYETLGLQIFELFPKFCAVLPSDIASSADSMQLLWVGIFGQGFSAFADIKSVPCGTKVLDSLIDKIGCDGCIELVMSQVSVRETVMSKPRFAASKDACVANIDALRRISSQVLGVLCDKFASLKSVAELSKYVSCIMAWLHIADSELATSYFGSLLERLLVNSDFKSKKDAAAFDLLIAFVPFINIGDMTQSVALDFFKYLSNLVGETVNSLDPVMQKRVYKGLTSLLSKFMYHIEQTGSDYDLTEVLEIESLLQRLALSSKKAASGAKKQRFLCLLAIVEMVPFSKRDLLLTIVPRILPEIIMGTKESGSKARLGAFSVLRKLGYRMLHLSQQAEFSSSGNGGALELSSLEKALEEDDAETRRELSLRRQRVCLTEYVTMVAAGTSDIGDTSLVAASLSCLGCLVYEFKNVLPKPFMQELVSQIFASFLLNRNKEMAKASLGAIKVAVIQNDKTMLADCGREIVVNLLQCHHQHNGRFRLKVRHLIERLLRIFSFEELFEWVPEDDKSWVQLIHKEKEKAKKAKIDKAKPEPVSNGGDSDSLLDELLPSKKSFKAGKPVIVESLGSKGVDDLLDAKFSNQIVSSSVVASKQGKRKRSLDLDNDEDINIDRATGKLVVTEPDAAMRDTAELRAPEDVYMEAVNGDDSFRKTPRGQIKFNKGRKGDASKTNESNSDEEEVPESTISRKKRVYQERQAKKQQQQEAVMLGSRYKSGKAGGDVKRKGLPQPYAYIPLQSKIVGNKKKSTKVNENFIKMSVAATKKRKL